tara:strand:- start:732 stop:938 length:207 start_codon:yes stop_codon:yes gene_type:complete
VGGRWRRLDRDFRKDGAPSPILDPSAGIMVVILDETLLQGRGHHRADNKGVNMALVRQMPGFLARRHL